MNSLKNLFIVAVLAAVGCGVWVSQHRTPEPSAAPAGSAAWAAPPQVQMNDMPGMPGGAPPAPNANTGLIPSLPLFSSGGSAAYPAGVSDPGAPAAASGGAAPAFIPGVPPATATAPPPPLPSSTTLANSGASAMPPPPASGLAPPAHSGSPGSVSDPFMTAPNTNTATAASATTAVAAAKSFQTKFDGLMQTIRAKLDEGHLADAHLALSTLYGDPDVPAEQIPQINRLLDQMAASVIYSRQHLLEPAYKVQPGDTPDKIGEMYNVPWPLLARINGIHDVQGLRPGRELKVVSGPFSAIVDLNHLELTLMLKGRYAGRFPIGVGVDHPRLEGTYTVVEKTVSPPYNGPEGSVAADDPRNPLGRLWIGLGNQIGIHGTNTPQSVGRTDNRGSICLGDRDIEDVFGILSIGSRVTIQR